MVGSKRALSEDELAECSWERVHKRASVGKPGGSCDKPPSPATPLLEPVQPWRPAVPPPGSHQCLAAPAGGWPGAPPAALQGVPRLTTPQPALPPAEPRRARPSSAPSEMERAGASGRGCSAAEAAEARAHLEHLAPQLLALPHADCVAQLNLLLARNAHRAGEVAAGATFTTGRLARADAWRSFAAAYGPAGPHAQAVCSCLGNALSACPEASVTAYALAAPPFLAAWAQRHGLDQGALALFAVQGFNGHSQSRPLYVPLQQPQPQPQHHAARLSMPPGGGGSAPSLV